MKITSIKPASAVGNSGPVKSLATMSEAPVHEVNKATGTHWNPMTGLNDDLQSGQLGKSWVDAGQHATSDIGNAYHTSIIDPVKKAAEHLKALAAGAGGGGGGKPGMVQVPQMPPGFQGGRLDPKNIVLAGPTAATINTAQGDQFRGYQNTLAQQLAGRANGTGTFVSDLALKQAQDQNQAQAFAQLASARGGANPMLARNTMNTSSDIAAQTARDATMAKLQEQQMAQQQLQSLAQGARGQDLQTATNQAQLNQQANLAGYQGGIQQMTNQAQLDQQYNELVAKYAAMGVDAQKANQMAAIEMQKNKNTMTGGLLSTAGTILGAYFGGPAGATAAQQATTPQQTQPATQDNSWMNAQNSDDYYNTQAGQGEGNQAGGSGYNGMR